MFGTHKVFTGRMRPACRGLDHAVLDNGPSLIEIQGTFCNQRNDKHKKNFV